jgi:adenine deaminase
MLSSTKNSLQKLKKQLAQCTKQEPADTVFKNCRIINVFNGQIENADVAVSDGIIVGVGSYEGKKEIDLKNAFLAPGLVDTHLHIESTMLSPSHFAAAVVPHGVTTCIADPHEIANVCGKKGIEYMIKEADNTPMDILFMLPSCVPATPFEDNGATFNAAFTKRYIKNRKLLGLGEFMNMPAVLRGDTQALQKILAATVNNKPVDGHLVSATQESVNAYVMAKIKTDHENVTVEEAQQKLASGMYVMLREGTATRNLTALKSIFTPKNIRRLLLCTDDKQVSDIESRGHLDNNIRMLLSFKKDIVDCITVAALNAAECYGLTDRGAIACGRKADFIVFDDIDNFTVRQVYKNGVLVAQEGKALFEAKSLPDKAVLNTMNAKPITEKQLQIKLKTNKAKVMRIMPHNVVTFKEIREVNLSQDNLYLPTAGLNKICVVERHKCTGNVGIGLIENYNIKNGAIALSVAHDSHNIIAVGDNDADIVKAVNKIIKCGGGWTVFSGGEEMATLPLPIAGLMSDCDAHFVLKKTEELISIAHKLGVPFETEPFMSLSFMSLVVIPQLKITDRGLFDVDAFNFTSLDA